VKAPTVIALSLRHGAELVPAVALRLAGLCCGRASYRGEHRSDEHGAPRDTSSFPLPSMDGASQESSPCQVDPYAVLRTATYATSRPGLVLGPSQIGPHDTHSCRFPLATERSELLGPRGSQCGCTGSWALRRSLLVT